MMVCLAGGDSGGEGFQEAKQRVWTARSCLQLICQRLLQASLEAGSSASWGKCCTLLDRRQQRCILTAGTMQARHNWIGRTLPCCWRPPGPTVFARCTSHSRGTVLPATCAGLLCLSNWAPQRCLQRFMETAMRQLPTAEQFLCAGKEVTGALRASWLAGSVQHQAICIYYISACNSPGQLHTLAPGL